jgi:ectoine hydroxylase-related dioxygenase (phytanoyl-CoA dioxygenase family)
VFAREQSDAVDPDSDYFRNAVPEDGRIKFAFNLDPLTRASGALRVIPGTQHLGPFGAGLFDEAANVAPDHLERKFGTPDDALRHWPLEVMPGDLVIFDNAALHAWFGGHSRRRMFSVQFREATKPVSPRSES